MKESSVAIRSSVIGAGMMVLVFLFQRGDAILGRVMADVVIYLLTFGFYFVVFAAFFFLIVGPLNRRLAEDFGSVGRFVLSLVIGLGAFVLNLYFDEAAFGWMVLVENVGMLASVSVAVGSYYLIEWQKSSL